MIFNKRLNTYHSQLTAIQFVSDKLIKQLFLRVSKPSKSLKFYSKMTTKSILIGFIFIIFNISLFSQDAKELYNQGIDLARAGNMQEAIKVFSKGLESKNIFQTANHMSRAQCYVSLGEFELAKRDINSGLKTELFNSDNINAILYSLKAEISSADGNKEEMKTAYQKAIKYAPSDIVIKNNYAFVLLEIGQPQEALEIYNEVLSKSQGDAILFNNRALGLIQLNRMEDARQDLEKSFELDRENPFLYKNYFLYHLALGNTNEACHNLKIALSKDMNAYGTPTDSTMLAELWHTHCGKVKD